MVMCRYSYTAETHYSMVNTLRLIQDGRHFPDYIFTCIFLNENASIFINISLKFVPKGPINNIPAKKSIIGLDNGLVPTRCQALV